MIEDSEASLRETLVAALRKAADAQVPGVSSLAREHIRLLSGEPSPAGESIARSIVSALNSPKTDYTDTFDLPAAVDAALEDARSAGQAYLGHLIGLRRPDLAALVRLAKESRSPAD